MDTQLVSPTSDVFVLYLFGYEHHEPILLSFINAVLTDGDAAPIHDVTVKNPFNAAKIAKDKTTILDVRARDERGHAYNVEIQNVPDSTYLFRILYYLAKMYAEQLSRSQGYHHLRPAISISIVGESIFAYDAVHSCHVFCERVLGNKLNDHMQVHFVETAKPNEGKVSPALRRIPTGITKSRLLSARG